MDEERGYRVEPLPLEIYPGPTMPPPPPEDDRNVFQKISDWISDKSGTGGVDESYRLTGEDERFDVETNYSPWGEFFMGSGATHLANSAAITGREDLYDEAINTLETQQRRSDIRRDIVGTGQWLAEQATVPASMLLAMVPGGAYGRGMYGVARAAGNRLLPRVASNPAVANAVRNFTTGGTATGVFGRAMEFAGNRVFPSLAVAASGSREIPGEVGGAGISEATAGAGYGVARGIGSMILSAFPQSRAARFIGNASQVVGGIAGGFFGYGAGEDFGDRIFGEKRRDWVMEDWRNWDWMKENNPNWIEPETQRLVEGYRY